jgi:hypothetical protein
MRELIGIILGISAMIIVYASFFYLVFNMSELIGIIWVISAIIIGFASIYLMSKEVYIRVLHNTNSKVNAFLGCVLFLVCVYVILKIIVMLTPDYY